MIKRRGPRLQTLSACVHRGCKSVHVSLDEICRMREFPRLGGDIATPLILRLARRSFENEA